MKKEELKEKIVQEVKAAKADIEKSSSGFAEEDLNAIQVFQENWINNGKNYKKNLFLMNKNCC